MERSWRPLEPNKTALESLLAALESLLECSWKLLAPVQGIPCTGQFKPLGACTRDSLYSSEIPQNASRNAFSLYRGFPVQGRDGCRRAEPVGRGYRGLYQYTGIVDEKLCLKLW